MRKAIISIFIVGIVLTLLSYALVVLIVSKAADVIDKEKTEMESYVGKKYVIDNDTVVVTDFTHFDKTVTLKFKDKSEDKVSTVYLKTLKEVK
jgi:hypothetical protein